MNTQRHGNPLSTHTVDAEETSYNVLQISASGFSTLVSRYRGPTLISLLKILRWCRTAGERSRQRKQLLEMDYRQLKDIGITRDQAEQEARKPIWKD